VVASLLVAQVLAGLQHKLGQLLKLSCFTRLRLAI
jgi:hypothetical protein